MPILSNARHERFAQELAKGNSATEAYRLAGYEDNRQSASRLLSNVDVLTRVRELKGEAARAAVLDRAWVIERLMANAERAMQAEAVRDGEGQETGEYKYEGSVANRALELLGKEIGMFVDKSEVTNVVRDISDKPATADEWANQHVTAH